MYKTILVSLLSTIFVACSDNSSLKYFEKDTTQARAVQFTKKLDILEKNEPKTILMATYLNNIKEEKFQTKNDKFLLNIYFTDRPTQDLKSNNYQVMLNDKMPLNIKQIEKNDKIYGSLLAQNSWGSYYLVEFESIKKVYKLNLQLKKSNQLLGQLNFEK